MDVTDVLRDRMHEPEGLQEMAALSVIAHAAVVAGILLTPGFLRTRVAEAPATVMTISLGGSPPGQPVSGMTPEGGRPVQEIKPPEEAARPEAIRPPAAKTPEMTLPEKNAKPGKTTPVSEAARGRTPSRGAETRPGSTPAETGVRGQGFGLSTGGAMGAGSYLDVSDFCCPEYLATMKQRIESHWSPRAGATGEVLVKFTIQRNGDIKDLTLEQSSGNAILDINAQRAVLQTGKLPALPAGFPNPSLTVHLNFIYQ